MIRTASRGLLTRLDRGVVLLSRLGISENFIRFGIVGTLGFCWDTSTVYALRPFVNLYIAGTCGFLVAATANWAINRLWTYRHHQHSAPHVQWARFITANAIGFVFNRGVYFALISKYFISTAKTDIFYTQPVLAIAAGSISGLCFNYFLSKRFVFS
jgi:putative flippase GtrA